MLIFKCFFVHFQNAPALKTITATHATSRLRRDAALQWKRGKHARLKFKLKFQLQIRTLSGNLVKASANTNLEIEHPNQPSTPYTIHWCNAIAGRVQDALDYLLARLPHARTIASLIQNHEIEIAFVTLQDSSAHSILTLLFMQFCQPCWTPMLEDSALLSRPWALASRVSTWKSVIFYLSSTERPQIF